MHVSARHLELGRFLRDRRGRVRPAEVGLPEGGRRRVAGLRREEVATLAGVGVTWYTMLENGTAAGVSGTTLTAIARALLLTVDETAYLHRLAEGRIVDRPRGEIGPLTRGALAAIEWAPAYICTSYWVVLAWNRAMSLVWGIEAPGGEPFNIVARMFGDPALRAMHGERFSHFAYGLVAMVRSAVAAHLEDDEYQRMCDQLRTDALFSAAWDAYDIATPLGSIRTEVESAALGTFAYETLTLEVPDDDGHWIVIQVPDASSAERLRAALSVVR
jgi:transcriptional regulator with XRE-family HTH domain